MTIKIKNIIIYLYAITIIVLGLFFILQANNLDISNPQKQKIVSSQNTNQKNDNNGLVKDFPRENVKENIKEKEDVLEISSLVEKEPFYSYEVVYKTKNVKINIGETQNISVKIKNTGNTTLYSTGQNPFFLGSSRSNDRLSVFYKQGARGWFSSNRILMDKTELRPNETATFLFQIKAPEKTGIYREFFTPVLDGVKWFEDKGIYWDIEVRDPKNTDEELKLTIDGKPMEYIRISLKEQNLYVMENGLAKYVFRTSTGLAGMDTPKGEFKIYNKYPVAYSAPYQLYMDNWMAFTPSGSHGIHSLPYWSLKNGGRLYEGEDHLGTPVSHGCIRISLENSKTLYAWAKVGTPVFISD